MASDQDELHQSGSHREEDVTQSPPAPGQRGQSEDETEVIRSQWHASEEPGEGEGKGGEPPPNSHSWLRHW